MFALATTPRSGCTGHAVRTIPRAVLATDARVGAVVHDAGAGVLAVGVDRTAAHTRRVDALIAAHREIGPLRHGIEAAFDLADAAPVDGRGVAVLLVARDDAALAADAAAHVEVEPVLFAGTWARDGIRPASERAAPPCPQGRVAAGRTPRRGVMTKVTFSSATRFSKGSVTTLSTQDTDHGARSECSTWSGWRNRGWLMSMPLRHEPAARLLGDERHNERSSR